MAFRHVPPHPGSPWQHISGPVIGLILLALVLVFAIYFLQRTATMPLPVESPAVVAPAVAAPLDQHERHPNT